MNIRRCAVMPRNEHQNPLAQYFGAGFEGNDGFPSAGSANSYPQAQSHWRSATLAEHRGHSFMLSFGRSHWLVVRTSNGMQHLRNVQSAMCAVGWANVSSAGSLRAAQRV